MLATSASKKGFKQGEGQGKCALGTRQEHEFRANSTSKEPTKTPRKNNRERVEQHIGQKKTSCREGVRIEQKEQCC